VTLPPDRELLAHVYENRAALAIHLDRDALAALDAEFPPPLHAQPLEVL
jgi:hypothetical protein